MESTESSQTPARLSRPLRVVLLIGLVSAGLFFLLRSATDFDESVDDQASAETSSEAASEEVQESEPAMQEVEETIAVDDTISTSTVADYISSADELTSLAAALSEAGLDIALRGDDPFTLFAPTNDAFAALDPDLRAAVEADPDLLASVLRGHVVAGSVPPGSLRASGHVSTLADTQLQVFTVGTDNLLLNNGIQIGESTELTNGVVYVVDRVILSLEPSGATTDPAADEIASEEAEADDMVTEGEPVEEEAVEDDDVVVERTVDALASLLAAEPITFADSSAEISSASFATLDQAEELITALIVEQPNASFEVGGHTDNIGPLGGNERLSDRRAQAVREYLLDAGVDPARLTAVGYGPSVPVADNATEAGRAANRRIEITAVA